MTTRAVHFKLATLAPTLIVASLHGQPAGGAVAADSTDAPPRHGRVVALADPGGLLEKRARLGALVGASPAPLLLRATSSSTPRLGADGVAVVVPTVNASWNSQIPFSFNDGPLWAGRGTSASLLAGIVAELGPLRLIVAPHVLHAEDRPFDSLAIGALGEEALASRLPPWQVGEHSIDLPYRHGARTTVAPGESSLTLRLGAVELGAASESQWWGPAQRAPLLLSSHAGGFPHLLARTPRPVGTPVGSLEARWIVGRLSASPYDTAADGGDRSLSAASVALGTRGGFQVGVARVVYATLAGRNVVADGTAVFTRWRGAGDSRGERPHEQMASVFGRWVAPGDGAEVYAEWGRRQFPRSVRDLLEQPEHTGAYTLGFGWARPAGSGVLRLRGEVTNLEKSPTYRIRPTGSWYASSAVPQGYTHRGQVLGAWIGPGASSQWASAEYARNGWEIGMGLTRVRWANDAYYDRPGGHNRYFAHDVSILPSLDVGTRLGGAWLSLEWVAGRRYNLFFQNPATGWNNRDLGTSPFNHTLRLGLSAAPPVLPVLR